MVTHEVASNSRKTIKIPNAAMALGVSCHRPWHRLWVERPKFVLRLTCPGRTGLAQRHPITLKWGY